MVVSWYTTIFYFSFIFFIYLYRLQNIKIKGESMKKLLVSLCFLLCSYQQFASNNPVTLNTAFNGTGYTSYTASDSSATSATASIVQPDGKIIAGGSGGPTNSQYILMVRYTTTGSVDTTFGTAGIVQTQFTSSTTTGYLNNAMNNMTIDSNGRILVVGTTGTIQPVGSGASAATNAIFVARYLSNGKLDTIANGGTGFGTGSPAQGYTIITPNNGTSAVYASAFHVAVQSTGTIVVGGYAQFSYTNYNNNSSNPNQYLVLAQLSNAGIVNTSWNNGSYSGIVITQAITNISATLRSLALQNDNIVIAGWAGATTSALQPTRSLLGRFTGSSGLLDTTFGSNGYVVYDFGQGSSSLTLAVATDANDTIAITGSTVSNGVTCSFVASYLSNGQVNTTFNPTGSIPGCSTLIIGNNGHGTGITFDENSKILMSGYDSTPPNNVYNQAIIARYLPSGQLDTTFSSTGYIGTQIPPTTTSTTSQTKHPKILDGKIIIAGQSNSKLCVLNYLNNNDLQVETTSLEKYGYNPSFISSFLYQNFYVNIITDATAQSATLNAINTIITNYEAVYANQANFNYIAYLYLIEPALLEAQSALLIAYPSSGTEINACFSYLNDRITMLLTFQN